MTELWIKLRDGRVTVGRYESGSTMLWERIFAAVESPDVIDWGLR